MTSGCGPVSVSEFYAAWINNFGRLTVAPFTISRRTTLATDPIQIANGPILEKEGCLVICILRLLSADERNVHTHTNSSFNCILRTASSSQEPVQPNGQGRPSVKRFRFYSHRINLWSDLLLLWSKNEVLNYWHGTMTLCVDPVSWFHGSVSYQSTHDLHWQNNAAWFDQQFACHGKNYGSSNCG